MINIGYAHSWIYAQLHYTVYVCTYVATYMLTYSTYTPMHALYTVKMKCGYHTVGVIYDTVNVVTTPNLV